MLRLVTVVTAVLVAGVGLAACGAAGGSGSASSSSTTSQMRERVTADATALLAGLGERGITVSDARGAFSPCSVTPKSTVEYAAGIGIPADADASAARAGVREILEADGWSLVDEDDNFVQLRKDDVRVSVNPDRATGGLAINVTHSCVDADRDTVDSLLGTSDDLLR